MVYGTFISFWDHIREAVFMPIKPVAQKVDLRPPAQLSASEVLAVLDANLVAIAALDSVFYRDYASVSGHADSGFCR